MRLGSFIFSMHVFALALAGPSPAGAADSSASASSEQSRKLYVTKCAKCHKLYDPAAYSDERWEHWVKNMGKKARLKPEQQRELERYLQSTYRTPRG